MPSECFGTVAADEEDEGGELVHRFGPSFSLTAPAFFEYESNKGGHNTWCANSGKESRIDNVLVADRWSCDLSELFVMGDEDLAANCKDNYPAGIAFSLQRWGPAQRLARRKKADIHEEPIC